MAQKILFFLSVFSILFTSKVSSNGEEYYLEISKAEAPPSLSTPAPVPPKATPSSPPPILHMPPVDVKDCPKLCGERCKLHSRPNHCLRVCGTCCFRCKCVPPGTSGNRELCGSCYTDMTTHGNRTKCP